jgi:hypothetical protein
MSIAVRRYDEAANTSHKALQRFVDDRILWARNAEANSKLYNFDLAEVYGMIPEPCCVGTPHSSSVYVAGCLHSRSGTRQIPS